MRTKYIDLIDQTFDFPQDEFHLREDRLMFHGIDLMRLIEEYGTPLKFNYLPQVSNNIQRAKGWFREAIMNLGYTGKYHYSYCTKSNHFSFVLDEVLKNDVHIETSSAFDIDIVRNLVDTGKLEKGRYVICNGYKPALYLNNIARLIEEDYLKVIPVVDNIDELKQLIAITTKELNINIDLAIIDYIMPVYREKDILNGADVCKYLKNFYQKEKLYFWCSFKKSDSWFY